MTEHSFGCLSDQEAMGLHDLSKAQVCQKTKEMTEEETFRKNYTEYCCGEKPLSPYWDLWQDGAEFGYNKGKNEAKEIIQKLIANAPNTYSGTNIEIQQKKMFAFQNAVNKAEQFLKE